MYSVETLDKRLSNNPSRIGLSTCDFCDDFSNSERNNFNTHISESFYTIDERFANWIVPAMEERGYVLTERIRNCIPNFFIFCKASLLLNS